MASREASDAPRRVFKIEFRKKSSRKSSAISSQLEHIKKRTVASGRGAKGWSVRFEPETYDGVAYSVRAHFSYPDIPESEAEKTIETIVIPAASANGWERYVKPSEMPVANLDFVGIESIVTAGQVIEENAPLTLPPDWERHFGHLYSREAQVGIVVSSVRRFIESSFQLRYHCCLEGPPGCGKTDLMRSLRAALGEYHVIEYDATATTSAGAIKDIASYEGRPVILQIEEIEKCEENALRWLLAVLDQRSELRKTNFHGKIRADVSVLCVATVNNVKLFESVMSGALASRFPHKIHCPRPDRKTLEMILKRDINHYGGNSKWIEPALDYASSEGITDPRLVGAICLCGGDDLLSGTYQEMLVKVKAPKRDD